MKDETPMSNNTVERKNEKQKRKFQTNLIKQYSQLKLDTLQGILDLKRQTIIMPKADFDMV